jgi:ATP:ADP antiporter, AAA family
MPPRPFTPDAPQTRFRTSAGVTAPPVSAHPKRARLTAAAERVLGLGRGELRPGLLLFGYLFLVIAACTAGKNTANTLFLDRFNPVRLPLADLATVAAVMMAAAGYMRLGRAAALRSLLVGSLLAFALTSAVFWWLVRESRAAWLLPAFYVWVGILGALAPTQVWTLANYVLTLRQAKRLFALVGCGSILGGIAGGAATVALSRARGAESLLLVMALAFTACAVLVPAIWRCPSAARRGDARRPDPAVTAAGGLRGAAAIVLTSRYLRLIGLLIALTALAATICGWQFKTIARASFSGKDELNAFFGSFGVVVGVIALGVQVFLTRPILRRVGLGAALSIVPIALAAGSAGLLALGSLAAVVALKGSDQALRFSIDKSAAELLFLPVPRAQTFQVKSLLSAVVSPFGDALGSVVILLFAWVLGFTPKKVPAHLASQLAWLTLALCAAWVMAAWSVHRQYLRNLAEALHENRVDVQGATAVLDRATTELLVSHLDKGESKRVLSALSLVEASRAPSVLPKVEALMSHASAAVRARAVAVLSVSRPKNPPPGVDRLLFDPDLRVRSAALLYMAHAGLDPLERMQKAGDFEDLSVRSAMVVYLGRSGKAQNLDACRQLLDSMVGEAGPEGRRARVEAARLVASLPNAFKEQLAALLADEDPDVVRHAIRAVGRLHASRFVDNLIAALAVPALAADAGGALARFGNRIVPKLSASLGDADVRIEARRELPRTLLRIGTPAAEQSLIDNLGASDGMLRFQVVSALNQLKRRHPQPPVDPVLVEKALTAEILAHYRSYLSLPGTSHGSVSAEDMSRQLECVFRLLQLLLPGRDINSAYVGVQSNDPVVHDKALEFLDNILAPHLRKMVVPLVDSKVEKEERAVIAGRLFATS